MNVLIRKHATVAVSLVLVTIGSLAASAQKPIPLKEAKLIIEHNFTDNDTGFQGFIDSDGWKRMTVTGPKGAVLRFEGRGALGRLGLTELFFETVEPANDDVPLKEVLRMLPEGKYTFKGPTMEAGTSEGQTVGVATLTHNIPEGPTLNTPAPKAVILAGDLLVSWGAVTKTITGKDVKIIAYQLLIEKDQPSPPNMIGKMGLSMYLPASVTSMTISKGFLEPGTPYKWEVLAIEESGNQTLSSGEFKTQ